MYIIRYFCNDYCISRNVYSLTSPRRTSVNRDLVSRCREAADFYTLEFPSCAKSIRPRPRPALLSDSIYDTIIFVQAKNSQVHIYIREAAQTRVHRFEKASWSARTDNGKRERERERNRPIACAFCSANCPPQYTYIYI